MIHLRLAIPRRTQRGLGLLEVLLLIIALGGLTAVGFLQWTERTAIQTARQEQRSLAQADQAVLTFATAMRRLPCPDTDRDGLEDCGSTAQKGWLPSTTLRLAGADAGVEVGQLRYVVQRGGGNFDLTVLDDAWRPLSYDNDNGTFDAFIDTTAVTDGKYPVDILTVSDLCQRLSNAAATPLAAGMAGVGATPTRALAYALVHPGVEDRDGDGSTFDGANALTTPVVDDPTRSPGLATYDDIVFERSYGSLQQAFQCDVLNDSINTVALGLDLIEQVDEMKADNIASAQRAIIMASLLAAITAIETTATVIEGISEAGNAAVAWAICAASLGLAVNACAAAPQHTAAIALTGGVIAANILFIAANITAAVLAGTALALADSSVDASSLTCPGVDLGDTLTKAKEDWDDAVADLAQLQTDIANKQTELANANTQRTQAINTLRAAVRNGQTSSTIDGRISTLINAANNYDTWSTAYQAADSEVQAYQEALNTWNDQVTEYGNMLANRTTMITQLENDIAALDAQIAATTDPATKESLLLQRAEKGSQLALLQDQAQLQETYDDAVAKASQAQADLNAALAARSSASSALTSATTSYQNAFNNLYNAGRYQVTTGTTTTWVCVTACEASDIVITSSVRNALGNLLGPTFNGIFYGTRPNPDSKLLRPRRVQAELDVLQEQLPHAQDRVTQAKNNYDQYKALADNPPPCNITGTGVTPMPPSMALDILITVDRKGGSR